MFNIPVIIMYTQILKIQTPIGSTMIYQQIFLINIL